MNFSNLATNLMTVPEIRNYSRETDGDRAIVRYEVRYPGERDWRPIELVSEPLSERVECVICEGVVPRRSTSEMPDGRRVCVSCKYGND